jgi:hypothetical protein
MRMHGSPSSQPARARQAEPSQPAPRVLVAGHGGVAGSPPDDGVRKRPPPPRPRHWCQALPLRVWRVVGDPSWPTAAHWPNSLHRGARRRQAAALSTCANRPGERRLGCVMAASSG